VVLDVKHIQLNNIEHRNLRVSTDYSPRLGDNISYGLVVPAELRTAQNFYPIFLQKDASTDKFFLSALFGFQEGENLFLDESGWKASYIPISIKRQPFVIGSQVYTENGQQKYSQVIHIDIESPRLNTPYGELLFTESGEQTPYLNNIADMLNALHHGLFETEQLVQQLLAYNLIEKFTLNIAFNEHKKYELVDFYTINEDVLRSLTDPQVVALFRSGAMDVIFSMLHSQGRITSLIELKKQQDFM
jgi:hypothetical protein